MLLESSRLSGVVMSHFRLNLLARLYVSLIILILALFFAPLRATPQSRVAGTPPVLRNPTPGQIHTLPRMSVGHEYGTIQAAISIPDSGPAYVYLPCGTYTENIVINRSDIRIVGEERGCVQLLPSNPALPVISIDATSTGQAGMGYDEVSDLTIACPTGATCGDGLLITGRTDIYQPDDWHKFSRLGIYGAFQNGINIAGRTIWTEFDNVEVARARGNGINIVTSATVNQLTFRGVRSAYNYNYGIYVNNTQKDLTNGILFDKVNVEYNGNNSGLPNCAGLYLTGVSQANITNSYFEGNCAPNTADKTYAEIRMAGTYNQSVNILDSVFNLQYTENGIYNDSVQTTGTYDGNKFTGSGVNGMTIYIATTHPMSNIIIGDNFSSTPTIVPDGNGISHVRTLSPFGLDYTAITSVSNNSIDVGGTNGAILYYGPYTIDRLINGNVGQIVDLVALNSGGHTLTNSAGGNGQIVFPDGMNRVLNTGESLLLYSDGTNWRPIEGSITSQARFVGAITTTAAPADTLAVAGLSASAHCTYSGTNAVSSTLTGLYITVGTGGVTLNHSPTAGATFDLFCSAD
jgi:hypothetical protein